MVKVRALTLSSCNGVRRVALQGGAGVVGGGVVVSGGVLTDATGPVGDADVLFGGVVGLVEFGGLAVVSGGPVVIGCVVGGATKSGKYCTKVNNSFPFLCRSFNSYQHACFFLQWLSPTA